MSKITLGILGGGQLGSMLSIAATKLNIKTVVFCNDAEAPAQNFCNKFIFANYDDKEKITLSTTYCIKTIVHKLPIFFLLISSL